MQPLHVVTLWAMLLAPTYSLRVAMISRRHCTAAAALCLLPSMPPAARAEPPTTRAELPPAAVILRVAEVTSFQEDILRQAASMSDDERMSSGYNFARQQMQMSVDILLKNTNLGVTSGCATPALTLGEIKRIAEANSGYLSGNELLLMAGIYSRARDELKVAFEAMPASDQAAGKGIVRRLTAEDDARKRQGQAEAEAEQAAARAKVKQLEARQGTIPEDEAQRALYRRQLRPTPPVGFSVRLKDDGSLT